MTDESYIVLWDKRLRVVWSSLHPLGAEHADYLGKSVLDFVPAASHQKITAAFNECVLYGRSAQYETPGPLYHPDGTVEEVNYRVHLYAVDKLGEVACVVVARQISNLSFEESERRLLEALANDKSLGEIAEALGKAESTIALWVKNLKKKLGRETLHGLVAEAIRSGVIQARKRRTTRPFSKPGMPTTVNTTPQKTH